MLATLSLAEPKFHAGRHITESQSWPLALERFPELAKHGAYSSSAVYTSHDIAGLVSFATSLGVSIMLEVDMPGHTASIAQSHPEHVACADKEPWEAYGVQPPPGQLRVRSKATAQFARDVTRDAARLTPAPLFSTGGDEVNMRCLEEEEQGGAGDIEQFVLGLHGTLREERKTPVVWQEMVLDHHVKLQHDTVRPSQSLGRDAHERCADRHGVDLERAHRQGA